MSGKLFFADAGNAASRVDAAFGVLQRVAADVGRQNLHVPSVGKRKRVGDGDGDRIRLFAGGTTRAPDAQRARILPELLRRATPAAPASRTPRKHPDSERTKSPESAASSSRASYSTLVLRMSAQEFRAARKLLGDDVLAHTSREKSLARFVETNACPLFDQHADLTQFVFAQPDSGSLIAHRGHVSAPEGPHRPRGASN